MRGMLECINQFNRRLCWLVNGSRASLEMQRLLGFLCLQWSVSFKVYLEKNSVESTTVTSGQHSLMYMGKEVWPKWCNPIAAQISADVCSLRKEQESVQASKAHLATQRHFAANILMADSNPSSRYFSVQDFTSHTCFYSRN